MCVSGYHARDASRGRHGSRLRARPRKVPRLPSSGRPRTEPENMLTRRALLKGAALTAGALIRIDDGPFDIAAQAVSDATVRILFLRRAPVAASRVPDDGALVQQEWPGLQIGR